MTVPTEVCSRQAQRLPLSPLPGLQPYLKRKEGYELKQLFPPVTPRSLTKQGKTRRALLLSVEIAGFHIPRTTLSLLIDGWMLPAPAWLPQVAIKLGHFTDANNRFSDKRR